MVRGTMVDEDTLMVADIVKANIRGLEVKKARGVPAVILKKGKQEVILSVSIYNKHAVSNIEKVLNHIASAVISVFNSGFKKAIALEINASVGAHVDYTVVIENSLVVSTNLGKSNETSIRYSHVESFEKYNKLINGIIIALNKNLSPLARK